MSKTTLLVVLDGWGYNESTEHNAIAAASTPTWDQLWAEAPHTLISGSGDDVGLPSGQMGNSEVGHMNLGAGRVVYQDLTRINRAIEQGEFRQNTALDQAIVKVRENGGALHVMGLLSPGGVHSHEAQINELLEMAADKGLANIYMHAFLDGRDTPPRSAKASLEKTEALLRERGVGRIASIVGPLLRHGPRQSLGPGGAGLQPPGPRGSAVPRRQRQRGARRGLRARRERRVCAAHRWFTKATRCRSRSTTATRWCS